MHLKSYWWFRFILKQSGLFWVDESISAGAFNTTRDPFPSYSDFLQHIYLCVSLWGINILYHWWLYRIRNYNGLERNMEVWLWKWQVSMYFKVIMCWKQCISLLFGCHWCLGRSTEPATPASWRDNQVAGRFRHCSVRSNSTMSQSEAPGSRTALKCLSLGQNGEHTLYHMPLYLTLAHGKRKRGDNECNSEVVSS